MNRDSSAERLCAPWPSGEAGQNAQPPIVRRVKLDIRVQVVGESRILSHLPEDNR